MFDDVLVFNTLIAIDIKLVSNVLFVIIDLDDALDFEHTDQQVFEEPDLDLLLDDDERSILQLDNSLVDFADCWRDSERDRPPLGRRQFEMCMGVHMFDNFVLARDVELERGVEVSPPVRLFWAHLTIHIHDEFLLATQVHAPLVDDFNPLPILRQGSRILDDNVNLMRHALDARHWELSDLLEGSHDSTMASSHSVLAIGRHRRELGTPNCCRAAQCIQEAGYQVENVLGSVPFEH